MSCAPAMPKGVHPKRELRLVMIRTDEFLPQVGKRVLGLLADGDLVSAVWTGRWWREWNSRDAVNVTEWAVSIGLGEVQ